MEKRSFDLIGDIAIIECENKKQEKAFIRKITTIYPSIKAILRKMSEAKGTYRLWDFKIVYRDTGKIKTSGLRITETIHKENGCLFKLDVRKAFFNPRDTAIKQHVSRQVREGERVLVMFSGIGSYPVRIAKNVKECEVVAVEINPVAVKYAEENARLNRVQEKIITIHGDVKKVCPRLGEFDQVIMPLAITGYKYLPEAFRACKGGGDIHLYGVGDKKNPYDFLFSEISKTAKKTKRKFILEEKKIIRNYSPSAEQVYVHFTVR